MGSNSSSVPTSAPACWGSKSEMRKDESAGAEENVGRTQTPQLKYCRWKNSLHRWTAGVILEGNEGSLPAEQELQHLFLLKLTIFILLTCFLLSGVSRQQTKLIQNGGGWGGSGGEGAGGAVLSQRAGGRRDQGTAQQRVLCGEWVWGGGKGTKTDTWISDRSPSNHFPCYSVSITASVCSHRRRR